MTLSLAVVCEGPADQRTGCGLADRVFLAKVDWLEEALLEHCRQWRGSNLVEPFLPWKHVPPKARARNIRAHGHFEGQPGAPDAHNARLALLLLYAVEDRPDRIVLLRDDDRQTQRRRGLEQARKSCNIGIPVAIGLAHVNRECWVLAGFEPQDGDERRCLKELRAELGFDPREHAEGLTAKHQWDKQNAKRVLDVLTAGSPDREARCWRETDLEVLATRGPHTGLADYLAEVQQRLLPLFRRGAASS